jgi:PAS domain-containing protein
MELLARWLRQQAFVAVADVVSSYGLLAAWREALLPSLLAAVVGLVVFSVLYASKIVAARRHVEELEKAVRALAESEQRFRTLCDHAPVGIFVNDGDGNGVYQNSKCGEIMGLSFEECQGDG